MQKMDGKICDCCRTQFYPGDRIIEMCEKCANIVWCVINVYEDGSKELSSIHHTEEDANIWMKTGWEVIKRVNPEMKKKILRQEKQEWQIL